MASYPAPPDLNRTLEAALGGATRATQGYAGLGLERRRLDQVIAQHLAEQEYRQQQLGLERERLDAAERARYVNPEDVAPFLPASVRGRFPTGPGRMRTDVFSSLLPLYATEAETGRQESAARALGEILGRPEQPEPTTLPDWTESGGAMVRPGTTREQKLAEALPWLVKASPAVSTEVREALKPDEQQLVTPGSGLRNKRTGEVTVPVPFPEPQKEPEYDPLTETLTSTTDPKNGLTRYSVRKLAPTNEREILTEAYRRFPDDPGKRAEYIDARYATQAGAKAGAAATAQAAARPPTDQEQAALGNFNQILASLAQMKQFTPEEVKAYVGLLQRPGQETLMALQSLPVVGGAFGKSDERFAEFKALMGRLKGTAFGEGGKQLTPFEARVVFSYTPTGAEPGGATEIMAKLRNLEAFTLMARATRLELMRTGKGTLDPDAMDAMLAQNMRAARLPMPTAGVPGGAPRPAAPVTGGSPAPVKWGRDAQGRPVRLP